MCNKLLQKLGALLRPKIETRKFALEVAWLSIKKEHVPAEISREGAQGSFFDSRGPTYKPAVPEKMKIDAACYCGVLQQLQRHIRRKMPELKHRWILHHDNARRHTTKIVGACLASKQIILHLPL